jgi:gas vesicle protein
MASENGGSGFLVGFMMGAIMGGMATLLLAPKSGREFRQSMTEETKKRREQLIREADRLRARAEETLVDLRERGDAAYGKAREGLTEMAETARRTAQEVKLALSRPDEGGGAA